MGVLQNTVVDASTSPQLNGDDMSVDEDGNVTTRKRKRQPGSPTAKPQTLNSCRGVYDGNFGAALSFAG